MKKENKRMAQQRRAQQREKDERKRKIIKAFSFWGPIVLVAVVVVVLIVAIATSGADSSGEDDSDAVTELDLSGDNTNSAPVLNTEEGTVVENGDTVNIDFVGYVDGEEFEGGNTNGAGYDLEIGSDTFIDGFEDGIIGHTVGETFDLKLQFPDPYENDETLSGKDVTFTTTINGIYE